MLLKEQQKKEIKQLQNNKDQVRDKAEMLAEMYDEKYEKQQALIKR
jgi:Nuclear pore component